MTVEEMLSQILEGQKSTNDRLDKMEENINNLRQDMTAKFGEVNGDISSLRQDMTAKFGKINDDIDNLQQDMTTKFNETNSDINDLRQDMTRKFGETNNNELELLRRQEAMQKDIKSIKITIENDICNRLKLLNEGHMGSVDQIKVLQKTTQQIEDDIIINPIVEDVITKRKI